MYRPYQIVKKILIALLCVPFLLILLSPSAHAQEVTITPTPTPTSDQSVSPSPSPQPDQVIEIAAQVEPSVTPTPTTSPLEETNQKSLATQITQTNDTSINNKIDGVVNTGINTAQDNISPQTAVDTGNASTSVAETNTANVNSAGDQYQAGIVDHHTGDPQIDLSGKTLQCVLPSSGFNNFLKSQNMTFAQFLAISQQNNASIINNINLLALTGQNSLSGINTKLNTGDASVDVSIVNIANVNTVGNCYFFAVINIYGDYDGDIILPYEYGYLFPQSGSSDQGVVIESADNSVSGTTQNNSNALAVTNENTSDVSTTLLGGADTGSNKGNADMTQTGNATMTLDERTMADQNITGDGWLSVQVNNYGTWDGQILGESNIPPQGSLSPQNSLTQTTSDTTISNQNTATIVNNLFLQAITGQNFLMALPYLGSGSITTGDASVTAKILNLLNTNVVGNNWYYVLVNVFGHWKGNIRFARPDLGIHAWWSKSHVRPGETVTLSLDAGNTGLVWSEKAKLNLHLPVGISLLSSDTYPNSSGNLLSWFWDRFDKNDKKRINLVLKVADDVKTSRLSVPIDIASGFREDEMGNNQTTATLEVEQPSSDSSQSQTVSLTSQTSPTLSVSPTPKKLKSFFASVQATEKKPGDTLSTSTTIPSSASPLGNTAFSQWWLLAGLIAVTVRRILQEE